MGTDVNRLAYPKPEPRQRVKARRTSAERRVITRVRAWCVQRDGHCRARGFRFHTDAECEGPSEWCHLGDKKRFKTRGRPATERHTTKDSLMLCQAAHAFYDKGVSGNRLQIEPMTDRGADGPLRFRRCGIVYEEEERSEAP